MEFKLTQEYIQLSQLLKAVSIVGSGGEAKMIILDGMVKVNGETELQVRKKLRDGDVVNIEGREITIKAK
jgi:ribosome-associated protein